MHFLGYLQAARKWVVRLKRVIGFRKTVFSTNPECITLLVASGATASTTKSLYPRKTLTTNNSVIHTMLPNTQDCRPPFVFVVSVVELMVTESQAY